MIVFNRSSASLRPLKLTRLPVRTNDDCSGLLQWLTRDLIMSVDDYIQKPKLQAAGLFFPTEVEVRLSVRTLRELI